MYIIILNMAYNKLSTIDIVIIIIKLVKVVEFNLYPLPL